MTVSDEYAGKPRESKGVEMSHNVTAGADVEDEIEEVPYDGFVDTVICGWPDGADQAVGLRIEDNKSGEVYFPEGDDEFVAFNSLTHPFDVTFRVEKGDELRAVFVNNKSYDVFINVLPIVKKQFPGEDLSYLG